MELFIGIIIVLIIISIALFFYSKKENVTLKNNESNYFPSIEIVENNEIVPLEKNKITDNNIKNAITTFYSELPKSAIINNDIKNGAELLNNNKAFFSALKKETKNMQQVGNTGKVRGIQMKKDKSTNRMLFHKQTEFTKEDALIKKAGKNALVNAGFNTASIIVGQYYMNEINNKLEDIKNDINEISNFLDSEYQGKIIYVISKLKEITDNRIEILNNEFSTKKRYDEIIDLEKECGTLLGQANDEIRKNIPSENIEYKNYERNLKVISKWFVRQQLLQRLLLEIGNLRYALASGNETSELSHSQYNIYLEQTNFINEQLKKMHEKMIKEYGIDIKKLRKNGRFYEIRKNTIGKIKEDWAYKRIDDSIVDIIKNQTNIKMLMHIIKKNKMK